MKNFDCLKISSYFIVPLLNQIHLASEKLDFSYIFGIALLKRRPISELVNLISNTNIIDFEISKKEFLKYYNKFSKNEKLFKMIDPITLQKIVLPAKSYFCQHLSCFDLKTYLIFNENISENLRWKCPICSNYASWENLQIDLFLYEVIQVISF